MKSGNINSDGKSAGQFSVVDAALKGRRSIALAASLASAAVCQTALGARAVKVDHVAAGSASFTTVGSREVIRASDKTIIDFNTFNVAPGETVQFIQPSSHATVLDYINSATPAQINGRITANGIVYFVDPAGVVFGPHSVVTANQVFAAGGGMTNSDFLAGNNKFELTSSVVNNGVINAAAVALTGVSVINSGSITANGGLVTFAVGNDVYIGPKGDTMTAKVTATSTPGSTVGSIQNTGKVSAPGGGVSMVAGDMFSIVLGNPSQVTASVINVAGGQSANTTVSGTLDASNAKGTGGTIAVTGKTVALQSATLNASGAKGGGSIKVGGDFHGQGTLATATSTTIDSASVVNASATTSGAGGKIAIWSNDTTAVHGTIEAKGINAAGGYIETSGHGTLDVSGISLVASGKTAGTWLMDPTDVQISDTGLTGLLVGGIYNPLSLVTSVISSGDIAAALSLGTSVVINTAGAGTGHGDISYAAGNTLLSNLAITGTASLTLNASRSIDIEAPITATSGRLSIDLEAASADPTGTVTIGSAIATNGGSITVGGNAASVPASVAVNSAAAISTSGGAVNLTSKGSISIGGAITAGVATVTLQSGAGITQTAGVTAGTLMLAGTGDFILNSPANSITTVGVGSAAIPATGVVNVTSSTALTVATTGVQTNANVILTAPTITIGGPISAPGSTVSLAATTGITEPYEIIGYNPNTGQPIYSPGAVTAATLALSGGGGISVNAPTNAIGSVNVGSSTAAVTGPVIVTSDIQMSVASTGAYDAGNLTLSAPGIAIGGTVSASGQTVTLLSTLGITQTATVTAGTLLVPGGTGDVILNLANSIGSLSVGSTSAVTGAVSVNSGTAMTIATGGVQAGGNITLSAASIGTSGNAITSSAGSVSLTATTPATGMLTIDAPVKGTAVNLTADNMAITDTVTATGGGQITIATESATTNVSLNDNTAALSLNTASLLDLNTTGTVKIMAGATSGLVYIGSSGSLNLTAGGYALDLVSGASGCINFNAGDATTALTTAGALTLESNVFLNNASSISAPTVNFKQGLYSGGLGNYSMTLVGAGSTTTFGGQVGGALGNLSSLTVAGAAILNAAGITTTGTQTYTGAVTLGAGTTLTGASVGFGSTVNGAFSLDSAANTTFGGAVSVANLIVGGTATINTPSITTTGYQSYTGAVTVGSPTVTLTAQGNDGANNSITISGNVGGSAPGQSLALIGNNLMTLAGAVGSSVQLASLQVNGYAGVGSSPALMISGGGVSTSTAQTYSVPVTLGAATTLTSGVGNVGTVTFQSTVGGSTFALTSNAATEFDGAVTINSLSIGGTTKLAVSGGTAVTTTGSQTYSGAVTLTYATTLQPNSSTVTFGSTVTGSSEALTISSSTSTAIFGGNVNVGNLTVDGAATLNGALASITTTGIQSYIGAVTVTGISPTLTGTSLTFTSGATGTGGLSTSGTTEFDGIVNLGLNLLVSGTATINTATVTTTGTQDFAGAVNLKLGGLSTLTGSSVKFEQTVTGVAGQSLSVAGNAEFDGAVGALTALTVSGNSTINIAASPSISTSGTQSYSGNVTLKQSATLAGSTVAFGSGYAVAMAGGTTNDALTITGAATIGSTISTAGFYVSGIAAIDTSTITTTGYQSYGQAVTLNYPGLITLSGEGNDGAKNSILFSSTVDAATGTTGDSALVLVSNNLATFASAVGGITPLTSLEVDTYLGSASAGLTLNGGTITTIGTQIYNMPVTLGANATLTGTTVSFGNNVTVGPIAESLKVSGSAYFGGTLSLSALTVTGSTTIASGSITTTGTQSYSGAVTLNNNATLTTGIPLALSSVTFGGGVTGAYALTSQANTTFGGAVNIASLSVAGTSAINTAGITTSGAQSYSGAVTLGTAGITLHAGQTLTFSGTVDGSSALEIQTGGNTTFTGAVGGKTSLTSLQVDAVTGGAGPGLTVSGGAVTTTGAQTFNVPVTATLTTSLNGASVSFGTLAIGSNTVTLNTTTSGVTESTAGAITGTGGTVLLEGTGPYSLAAAGNAFGSVGTVGLATTGNITVVDGNLSIASGGLITTGTISLKAPTLTIAYPVSGSALTLLADSSNITSTVTATNTTGVTLTIGPDLLTNVDLNDNTTPAQALSLTTAELNNLSTPGTLKIVDSGSIYVGSLGSLPLTTGGYGLELSVGNAGVIAFDTGAGAIALTTKQGMTFDSPVTLGTGVSLSAPTVNLTSTVTGAYELTSTAPTMTTFGGVVNVGALSVNGPATINTTGITSTTGGQSYSGAVTLGAASTLNAEGAAGTGAVGFASTLDGGLALTIDATGQTTFSGVVGGSANLASLSVSAYSGSGASVAIDGGAITTTGSQTFNVPASINQTTTLTGSAVTFGSGDVISSAAQALNVHASATFGGNVTLASLHDFGNTEYGSSAATATTTGAQQYDGAVTLDGAMKVTGSSAVFGSTVTGSALTSNAATTFDGSVGVANLSVGGSTLVGGSATAITTTNGTQVYSGPVTLGVSTTTTGNSVTFGSTATISGPYSLTSDAATSFDGAVSIASLAVNGTTSFAIAGAASVTTTGTQTYNGLVTLASATTLGAPASTITFMPGSSITGSSYALAVTSPTTAFGGNVTVSNLTVNGAAALNGNLTAITTTAGTQTYAGAVTLSVPTTTMTGAVVTFDTTSSTITGTSGTLNITAATTFDGAVNIGSLSVTGAVAINTTAITTTGAQTYQGGVALGSNTALSANSQSSFSGSNGYSTVTFTGVGSTVTGAAYSLTSNANTEFDGVVSVGSLGVAGTAAIDTASITTVTSQTYQGAATLGTVGAVTLTAQGATAGNSITFQSTLDGSSALTINTAGTTSFENAVGGGTALASLAVNPYAGGSTPGVTVGVASGTMGITTTGVQAFNVPMKLAAATSLTTQNAGTSITFSNGSTIDGGYGLTLSTPITTLGGAVGATTALASLTVTGTTTLTGTAASVTTTGAQSYGGAFGLLVASATHPSTPVLLNGNTVNFGGMVGTPDADSLAITGATTFNNTVSLANLKVSGASTFQSLASSVTTIGGSQTYTGAVQLNVAMTTYAGTVGFGGTVNGSALTSNAATTFGGNVNIANLTVNGTTAIDTASITTGTFQNYAGAVSLGVASIQLISQAPNAGQSITFASTVDGTSALEIMTSGTTTFNGLVGGTTSLTSLKVDPIAGGGTPLLSVAASGITTTGSQTYDVPMLLTSSAVTTLTTGNAPGTNITFSSGSTIHTSPANSYTLVTNSPTTVFGGDVAVGNLTVNNAATLNGNLTTVTTAGTQSYGGAVTLDVPTAGLTGTAVTFRSTIGSLDSTNLNVTAATTFDGTVNAGTLSVTGSTLVNTTAITTAGAQVYSGAVTLGSNTTMSAGTANPGYSTVTFSGPATTVTGTAYSLTSNANTEFDGTVSVGKLIVAGTSLISTPSITTSTSQEYDGATTLLIPSTIVTLTSEGVTNGNSITFNSTVDGIPPLVINTTGTTTFNGVVGGTISLEYLVVQPYSGASTPGATPLVTVNTSSINTLGPQEFDVPMTLGTSTSLNTFGSGDWVTFSSGSTVTGPAYTLNVNSLSANFGGNVTVGNLNVGTAAIPSTTTLNGVATAITTTGGAQNYTGAVTLSVPSAATITMTGNAVTFGSTVSTTTANSLIVTANTTFNNTVTLANLTVNGPSTFQNQAATVTTLNGTQTYNGNVTLDTALATTTTAVGGTAGAVTFGGTVTGAALTSASGLTTFDGNVNIASLTVYGATAIDTGSITTGTFQGYNGAVTLDTSTVTTGTAIQFGSTVTGAYSLTSTAATTFDGVVNIATLAVNGTTNLAIASLPSVITTGTQVYNGAVTLSDSTTLNATSSSITFTSGSTITGTAESLALNSPSSSFGGSISVANLTVSGAAIMNGVLTTVTTGGTQTYGGAVTLSVPTVGMTGAAVTFDSTVGSTDATNLNVTAATTFDGTVNIGTLSVVGTTLINTTAITTSGGQTYLGAVTLGSNTTLTATNVLFSGATSTVSGAYSLTSAANTTFDGLVNIGNLTVTGTTAINTPGITTGTFQKYNGAVTLGSVSGVTMTAKGTDGVGNSITFVSSLDATAGTPTSLQINTYGLTTFGGAVGNRLTNLASALSSLEVDGTTPSNAPSVTIAGSVVNTTTTQVYDVPVTLASATQINATHVTFAKTVSGATLFSNANTLFDGIVTAANVTVTGTTDIEQNASAITTANGFQLYDGAVTIGVPVTLTGNTVTFKSTVNGASLTSTAANTFDGNVAVANLTVNGTSTINTASIITGTFQYYNGAVGIDWVSGLTLTSNGTDTTNHSITFVKTLDSTINSTPLLVNTTGITTFDQAVGSISALKSLTVTAVAGGNASAAIDGGLVTTATSQTYSVPVTVAFTGMTTLNATTALFGKTLTGTALTNNANTTFDGNVNLANLTVDGTSTINTQAITTGTYQYFNGAVGLDSASGVTLTSNGTDATNHSVTFVKTLDSTGATTALAVLTNGITTFDQQVGSISPLASLTVTGAGGNPGAAINGGLVTTTGSQAYNVPVTLGDAAAVTTLNATTVLFGTTLNGTALNSNANTTFDGIVNVANLTVDGTTNIATTGVTTGSFQLYKGATTLTDSTVLTGSTVQFISTVNGASLVSNAATTFDGNVTITSLNVNGTTTTDTASITTTTLQDYNGAVTLQVPLATNAGTTVTFDSTVNGASLASTAATTTFDADFNIASLVVNGVTNIDSPANDTTTSQLYNGAVVIGVPTGLTGTTVMFKSTVNGQSLTSTAATTFDGNVSVTDLTVNGTSAIDTASITTGTFQDFNGAVTLNNAGKITLTSNGANAAGQSVTFVKTLDAATGSAGQNLDVVTTGVAGFQGAVGTTPLATLTVDPVGANGSVLVTGGSISTTATQVYNVPVTLGNAAVTNASTVTFNKTLTGAALTSNAATIFNGNVTVANLTDNGTTAINTPVVTTTTFQDYNGAVTLGSASAVTLTANGADGSGNSIAFVKTLDGNASGTQALNVVASGLTTFGGAVGTTPLLSLQVNPVAGSGATTAINGGAVTTTSFQTYNVPVTLGVATVMNGSINTFNTTLTGAALTSNATTTIFDGNISIAGLVVNGITQINTASVNTTTSQVFNGATTLGYAVAPATDGFNVTLTAGTNVTFASTLDASKTAGANQSLDVVAGGLTTFTGTVGSGSALYNLQLDGGAASGAAINGGVVTTQTYQTYNVPVTILNPTTAAAGAFNTTLTSGASSLGNSVTFNKTLDAAGAGQMVDIVASGLTTLNAAVGKTMALGDLQVDPAVGSTTATIAINGKVVTTTATQVYNVPVTLGNPTAAAANAFNTVLTGSAVTFNKTVDANKGVPAGQSLDVITTGQTIFQQPVGSLASLLSLQVDPLNGSATAGSQVNGGSVTTSSYQTYNVPVTLGDVAIAASGGFNTVLKGTTVTFSNTLDAAAAVTGQALDVQSAVQTTFQQAVGSTLPLLAMQLDPLNGSALAGAAINGGAVTTTTTQIFNVPVTLGNLTTTAAGMPNTTLSGTAVTFNNTLNAGNTTQQLDIKTTGATSFMQKVGSIASLAGLQVDPLNASTTATALIDGGYVSTTGLQTYNVPVTVANATAATVTSPFNTILSGSNVTFAKTLNAAAASQTLDVIGSGTTTFVGTVGSAFAPQLQVLQVDGGAAVIDGGSVTTSGKQTYDVPVTLGNPVAATSASPFNNVFTATTTTFAKAVTTLTNLVEGLQVNGTMVTGGPGAVAVTTTGSQLYTGAMNLDSSTSLTASTVNSATVDVTGQVTAQGASTSFGAAGYQVVLHGVTTTGDQTYLATATGDGTAAGFVFANNYTAKGGKIELNPIGSGNTAAQLTLTTNCTFETDAPSNLTPNTLGTVADEGINNVTLGVTSVNASNMGQPGVTAKNVQFYNFRVMAGTTFLMPVGSSTTQTQALPTGVITVGGAVTANSVSLGWEPNSTAQAPAVASIVLEPVTLLGKSISSTPVTGSMVVGTTWSSTDPYTSTQATEKSEPALPQAAFSMDRYSKMSVLGWSGGLQIVGLKPVAGKDSTIDLTTGQVYSANLSDIDVDGTLQVEVQNLLTFVSRAGSALFTDSYTSGSDTFLTSPKKDVSVGFVATKDLEILAREIKVSGGGQPLFSWGDASDGSFAAYLPASLVLTTNSVTKYLTDVPSAAIEQGYADPSKAAEYTMALVPHGSGMQNSETSVITPAVAPGLRTASGVSATEKDQLEQMGIQARDVNQDELLTGLDGRSVYYQDYQNIQMASARIDTASVEALLALYNKYYSHQGTNSKGAPSTAQMQSTLENAWTHRSNQQATGEDPEDIRKALYEDKDASATLYGLRQMFVSMKQLAQTELEEKNAKQTILRPVFPQSFYDLNDKMTVDKLYDFIMDGPSVAVSPAPAAKPLQPPAKPVTQRSAMGPQPTKDAVAMTR